MEVHNPETSLELRCENNAFYIFVYVLANSPLATRGSGRKKLPPPMRRIPGVGGWVTKKLMAMQAEVLNQSLVDKLLDDDENQRPRTPYICTSFFSVSSSNPCLADHPYSAENLCLADNPCPADNPCFTQLNPIHLSSPLPLAKAELYYQKTTKSGLSTKKSRLTVNILLNKCP